MISCEKARSHYENVVWTDGKVRMIYRAHNRELFNVRFVKLYNTRTYGYPLVAEFGRESYKVDKFGMNGCFSGSEISFSDKSDKIVKIRNERADKLREACEKFGVSYSDAEIYSKIDKFEYANRTWRIPTKKTRFVNVWYSED